jgi:hypothetical protein
LLVAALLFGVSYGRTLLESRSALRVAKHLEEESGLLSALPSYRESIRWRAPLNPYAGQAIDHLASCALSEDCTEQLAALRALREGITASRSWLTRSADQALLTKLQSSEEALIGSSSVRELSSPQWNPFLQIAAQCALWGWLLGFLVFLIRGITREGGLNMHRGRPPLVFSVLSFAAWLIFLAMA